MASASASICSSVLGAGLASVINPTAFCGDRNLVKTFPIRFSQRGLHAWGMIGLCIVIHRMSRLMRGKTGQHCNPSKQRYAWATNWVRRDRTTVLVCRKNYSALSTIVSPDVILSVTKLSGILAGVKFRKSPLDSRCTHLFLQTKNGVMIRTIC